MTWYTWFVVAVSLWFVVAGVVALVVAQLIALGQPDVRGAGEGASPDETDARASSVDWRAPAGAPRPHT